MSAAAQEHVELLDNEAANSGDAGEALLVETRTCSPRAAAAGGQRRLKGRRCAVALGVFTLAATVLCAAKMLGQSGAEGRSIRELLMEARPAEAVQLEALRRRAAEAGDTSLLTLTDVLDTEANGTHSLLHGTFWTTLGRLVSTPSDHWNDWKGIAALWQDLQAEGADAAYLGLAYMANVGFGQFYPFTGFVQGFPQPGFYDATRRFFNRVLGIEDPKWKPPVKGETMGIMSYGEYSKKYFGRDLGMGFFDDYYTGEHVPSWEDNTYHKAGVAILDKGMAAGRLAGVEPMEFIRPTEPRFAFDNEGLTEVSWKGFDKFGPREIKYASNGVFGIALVESLVKKYGTGGEVLGPLMTDSAFSAHLRHDGKGLFTVDMTALEKYTPLPGYARLGGKAFFKENGGSLALVRLEYGGEVYTDFHDPKVNRDYQELNKRSGWRFAEAAFISSLLSMTNLVLHVKDLHLELAAAFQAVTVDAFAEDPRHPVRRLLDPFISRSVQATNDNFKLLFQYDAAEFSLAPLSAAEQLKLIDDFIKTAPLNLADMDMEHFGKARNVSSSFSTAEAVADPARFGWRWHYRALTVQRLYEDLVGCWLDIHYSNEAALQGDTALRQWWRSMVKHLPALARATQRNPEWASASRLTRASLTRVLKTLLVWVSWIHEDVGHSAASYVYNPVYTPMCVPEDGIGVPLASFSFNVAAYRGFVFLERSALLDEPPSFWFDTENCQGFWWFRKCSTPAGDASRQCFANLQAKLISLGQENAAFSECDTQGFYSCVHRVETAVSS